MPYQWTSCKFNQRMYDEFRVSNETNLVIIVAGGQNGGGHPPGTYTIPRDVALNIFEKKSTSRCWTNLIRGTIRPKNEWSQASVPSYLQTYFIAE